MDARVGIEFDDSVRMFCYEFMVVGIVELYDRVRVEVVGGMLMDVRVLATGGGGNFGGLVG